MIIDWISFTIKLGDDPEWIDRQFQSQYPVLMERKLLERVPSVHTLLYAPHTMTNVPPRAPYSVALSTRYVAVYAHPGLSHMLIEVNGQGCAKLREAGAEEFVLAHVADAVTRVDIAADIPDVTPDEIVEAGVSDRFRSRTRSVSDTGTTIYIGSRKSERFARVYRYAPPHERSGECRVEIVSRKRYAKDLAHAIVENGLERAGRSSMAVYEWEHPALAANAAEKLSGRSIDKKSSKTEVWLIRQAAPAFKRLVREGVIDDPITWLERHMLTLPDHASR